MHKGMLIAKSPFRCPSSRTVPSLMIEPQPESDRLNAASESNSNPPIATHAECEALKNDVHQAREMAAEFQRQLAGKSNELWELKRVYETTAEAVTALQSRVTGLRRERHALANKAIQVTSLEQKLASISAERDRLQTELTALRQGIAQDAEESLRRSQERDAHVARLTVEVAGLKQRLEDGRAVPGAWAAARRVDAEVKTVVAEISNSLARLMAVVEPTPGAAKAPPVVSTAAPAPVPPAPAESRADDEYIDISFAH